MTIDGDSTTGKFDPVNPIPVTFNAEHTLSATIEFGDMKFTYSVKEDRFDESCFDGENNKVTVTNNSTCEMVAKLVQMTDETYSDVLDECGFRFSSVNENGLSDTNTIYDAIYLSYDGDTSEGAYSTYSWYLTVKKDSNLEAIHGYQFNDAKIGEITIELVLPK